MVNALSFVQQADGVTRKASDVSAADWRYQTRVKKIIVILRVYSKGSSFVKLLTRAIILHDEE